MSNQLFKTVECNYSSHATISNCSVISSSKLDVSINFIDLCKSGVLNNCELLLLFIQNYLVLLCRFCGESRYLHPSGYRDSPENYHVLYRCHHSLMHRQHSILMPRQHCLTPYSARFHHELLRAAHAIQQIYLYSEFNSY